MLAAHHGNTDANIVSRTREVTKIAPFRVVAEAVLEMMLPKKDAECQLDCKSERGAPKKDFIVLPQAESSAK